MCGGMGASLHRKNPGKLDTAQSSGIGVRTWQHQDARPDYDGFCDDEKNGTHKPTGVDLSLRKTYTTPRVDTFTPSIR